MFKRIRRNFLLEKYTELLNKDDRVENENNNKLNKKIDEDQSNILCTYNSAVDYF